MRRRLLLPGLSVALVASLAVPAAAQDGGGATSTSSTTTTQPTSTTTTTTSSTTQPAPPPTTVAPGPTAPTTPTIPGETTTTTTSTTAPSEEDPVSEVDAAPEEVPINDATVPPPPGAVIDGAAATRIIRRELKVARAEALQSSVEVDEAALQVDDLSERLATLQRELSRLGVAQELAVARLEAAQERFEERVANAVVRGNAAELDTIISSENANEVLTRKMFLETVAEADTAAVRDLQAARKVLDAGVLAAVDEVASTRRELRAARDRLRQVLAVNAERRFQLAVFAAGSEIVIRGFVFPVGEPYTFGDSWGYPRMTGTEYEHGHQGTDIMAPFGTPLYATERGIIIRVGSDVLGGTKLWVKGESGTYYYYAHLQSFADGIGEGTVVDAGAVVGFVGDTGNAKGGAPHLHFQVHPGGGPPVNPYGLLRAVANLSRR